MAALVGIAIGLLVGAWSAALGWRLPHAWMGNVAVLGVGGLLMVSTRSAGVQPGRRATVVAALLAVLVGQSLVPPERAPLRVPRGLARVEGTVLRTRHGDRPRARLRLERGAAMDGGADYTAGLTLDVAGLDMPSGSEVRLLARTRPRQRFDNPTPHPAWPAQGRPDGYATLLGQPGLLRPASGLSRVLHAMRGRLRRQLVDSLSPRTAGLARALLLGEARAVPELSREAVRGSGMSHVLAVSGLHVALLAGMLVWLLRAGLRRVPWVTRRVDPKRLAAAAGVPMALFYAALVGDAPSAWRAAVTASVAWTLTAIGRRADPRRLTAVAVLVLAILRPEDLTRPGFVLSIVATAAIVTGLEAEDGWVQAGLRVTARTMVATAPVIVWMFGGVPLVGLLSNLVAVPIVAVLLLPLTALHALLGLVWSELGLAWPIEHLTDAFFATSEVLASLSWGVGLPPPSVAEGIVLVLAAMGLLAARRWRARLGVLLCAVAVVGVCELHLVHTEQPRDGLRATFLDVGQGDAVLIDLPDGRLMVVDAGGAPNGGPDPGIEVLVPLLEARRRKRIDVLVLSHPHPDHYGGMQALLEHFEVAEIWDSGQAERETPESAVATLIRDAGVPVRGPDALCAGHRAFGGAVVRTLAPCPDVDVGWGPNENSLVLEIEFGRRRLLLTGDAEAHAEATLLAGRLRSVDVLKVAHHGSRTSTSEPFLRRVRPSVAIASLGRQNRYGHPHPEVWSRLQRDVDCPLRTDLDGGVTVFTDGESVRVETSGGRACGPTP
ncbi:MAG: DNA internalization-related competence protein ComEC/Rec2 [Sandaracinaceae bacterium]